jgi:hypothetical protein
VTRWHRITTIAALACVGLTACSMSVSHGGADPTGASATSTTSVAAAPSTSALRKGSWSKGTFIASNDGGALTGVSCPSVSFCVAVDSAGSAIEYSGGSWLTPNGIASPNALVSVSCLNSIFCTAIDSGGTTYTFASGSWSQGDPHQLGTGVVGAVCTAGTTCFSADTDGGGRVFAVDGGWGGSGSLLSGTDPAGTHYPFTSLSCVMAFCMAVDAGGDADSSGNQVNVAPGNGSMFGLKQLDTKDVSLTSVSCAFEADPFCIAVDNQGHAFTYSDYSWSSAHHLQSTSGDPTFVSCTTTSFCISADHSGKTFIYANGQWSTGARIDLSNGGRTRTNAITAISCATFAFCRAVSSSGYEYTLTNSSVKWSPSSDYQRGWNAFLVDGVRDTDPTCSWHEGTPSTDMTRGCADASRIAQRANVNGGTTPTTFPIR